MNKRILILLALLIPACVPAGYVAQVQAYILNSGVEAVNGTDYALITDSEGTRLLFWAVEGLDRPVEADLLPADEARELVNARRRAQRQAAKPDARKVMENRYLDLRGALLGGEEGGVAEMREALTKLAAADPIGSMDLYLELITVVTSLSAYGPEWEADVARHEVAE